MPIKEVEVGGSVDTELVDGGQETPVIVDQAPTRELVKDNTRFISSLDAPRQTTVDSNLQVKGKLLDKDGNEITKSELGDAISADEIDSGSATSGKVLTADGHGGASWQKGLSNPVNENLIIGTKYESGKINETYSIKFPLKQDGGTTHYCEISAGHNQNDKNWLAINGIGTDTEIGISGYLYCFNNFRVEGEILNNVNTFTPATTGTITKEQADLYVQKIQSGWLCRDSGYALRVAYYYEYQDTVGMNYLVLSSSYNDGSSIYYLSITYKLNSDGTLDVNRTIASI